MFNHIIGHLTYDNLNHNGRAIFCAETYKGIIYYNNKSRPFGAPKIVTTNTKASYKFTNHRFKLEKFAQRSDFLHIVAACSERHLPRHTK